MSWVEGVEVGVGGEVEVDVMSWWHWSGPE